MASMFDKKTEIGGAFKANEMILTFAGFGAGYLITGVKAGYQVQVSRFREIGSNRTYYVEGDSSGTLSLQQVTGPSSSIVPLLRAYSDVCSIAQNTISLSFAPGQCAAFGGGESGLTFSGVLFNSWGLQSSSQNGMTSNTSIAGAFETLESGDDSTISGILNTASNVAGALGV